MKSVSIVFLAVFACWALSIVHYDRITRKIPRAGVKTGLKLLAAGLGGMAICTWLGYAGRLRDFPAYGFYVLFSLHLLLTALAGILLWYAEVWPAGDAKFFMLVSAALPLAAPGLRHFPDYLFLDLLINIFAAASIWVVASSVVSWVSGSPAASVRRALAGLRSGLAGFGKSKFALASYLFGMTFALLLQQTILTGAGGILSRFFSRADVLFFFVFILWGKLRGFLRTRLFAFVAALFCLVYFAFCYLYFRESLPRLLAVSLNGVLQFGLLLFFGRMIIGFLLENKDKYYLGAEELEPGVVLSSRSADQLKKTPGLEGDFENCFKDGLTQEQVSVLKSWLGKQAAPENKLEVVRGKAFASWIFAGAAITLVFNRNLVELLMRVRGLP